MHVYLYITCLAVIIVYQGLEYRLVSAAAHPTQHKHCLMHRAICDVNLFGVYVPHHRQTHYSVP